jgi:uncharacterized membrane protein
MINPRHFRHRVGLTALAAAAATSAAAGSLQDVTTITVPGAQAGTTTPYAINNAGEIAGEYLDPAVGFRVFALTAGSYAAVDPGPTVAVNGSGFVSLDNAGQIVGYADTATGPTYGYYYLASPGGAISGFPPSSAQLPGGVTGFSFYNDQGAIAGEAGSTGFVAQGGSVTVINPPTSTDTVINAINDTGGVVGQFDPATPVNPNVDQEAFVYQNGTYTTLLPPGAQFVEATGINDHGEVVGYFDGAPVTGSNGIPVTPIDGFTYENGVYTEYSVAGEAETELFAINDSNQVVGYESNEDGAANGFSAVAVPEPATWTLLIGGLGLVGAVARTRRRPALSRPRA